MRTPFPPDKSALPEVTGKTLSSEVAKHKFAIVSVRADWCGFCPAIAPTIDAIAKEQAGKVGVFRMEFDSGNAKTLEGLKVEAIPTVLFFRDGKEVGRTVGADSAKVKAQLAKLLKQR